MTGLSRREWLAACAAGLIATQHKTGLAETNLARLSFGFSLYGMRSLKTLEALVLCAEIGYSGVELPVMKDWPCDAMTLTNADRRALRKQLQDQSLKLPALMENLVLLTSREQHAMNRDRLKAACEVAKDLGDATPPVIETVLGGKPADWPNVREQMAETLASWESIARQHEVIIAIKPHAFGALHRAEDARWLVREVGSPWIRAVYDYSHYERQGFEMEATVESLLPMTSFVHVKDNITREGKTEFVLPGEGQTDYVKLLKLLRDGGYSGAVVVEVSAQVFNKPGYDPEAAARLSYKKLMPAFLKTNQRARV